MTEIDIMELPGDGICAIIPAPTGFTFSTQAGGTSCTHPSMEGILIPLTVEAPRGGDPLLGYWWHKPEDWILGGEHYPLPRIRKFLAWLGNGMFDIGGMFRPDEDYRGEGGEAWVPVVYVGQKTTLGSSGIYALAPFVGRSMILTYGNSD